MPDGEEEMPGAGPEEEIPEEPEEEEGPSIRERAEDLKDKYQTAKRRYEQAKDLGQRIGERFGKKAAKEVGKETGKAVAKTGAKAAARGVGTAAKAGARAAVQVAAQAARVIGQAIISNPYVALAVGIIILVIGIIVIIILVIWILWLMHGGAGQSMYMSAGDRNGPNKAIYDQMQNLIDQGKIKVPDSKNPNAPDDPTEKEFLLGAKNPKTGQPIDIRLLKSLVYLGQRHEMIHISHILYPYVYMPIGTIETKDTKDEKFQKSISAHKEGKAVDIDEIDYVCEKCECSEKCGDKKVPIKVVWQDDPIKTDTADRGISREAGIALLEESLGLPEGSLEGKNLEEVIENSGRRELERYLKLDAGSLNGKDLQEIINNLGLKKLNEKLNLPTSGSDVMLSNLDDFLKYAGQSKIEEIFNILAGGFNGQNLKEIAINLGRKKFEKELGLPEGALTNKDSINRYAQLKWGGEAEKHLKETAKKLNLPENILLDTVNQAKAGQDISGSLKQIGTILLSRSLGLPDNVFASVVDSPSTSGFQLGYNEEVKKAFWGKLSEIEKKNNLPDGSLRNLLNVLSAGGNPKDVLQEIASKIMGDNLGFEPRVILDLAKKRISLDEALAQAKMTRVDLAAKLGISEQAVIAMFTGTEDVRQAIREVGQLYLALEFGISYDILGNFLDGKINYNTLLSQANINLTELAKQWGLPENALTSLISGNPKEAFKSIGYKIFEDNFGLTGGEIDAALNYIASGDLEAAVEAAVKEWAKNYVFSAVATAFGLSPETIPMIMNFIENPLGLIDIGISMLSGGGIWGGLVGGIFGGGIFGGGCNTDCYREQAQKKVHTVVKELMEMPLVNIPDLGLPDLINMRITQIIVWSYNRDVLPFETGAEKPSYEDIYGKRPIPNYGLFATTENNYLLDHIHIGY